jgi:hypothetical protein
MTLRKYLPNKRKTIIGQTHGQTINPLVLFIVCSIPDELTLHTAAAEATNPPDINMGFVPLVLLNTAPLMNPAAILFAGSSFFMLDTTRSPDMIYLRFPLKYPIYELIPLYIIATTPAEFPKNGPLLVTPLSIAFNLIFGGAEDGTFLIPSANPRKPPVPSADRYVIPVP